MVPGSRIVLGRADRQTGNRADDNPEQNVAQPSPKGDADAGAKGHPRFNRPLVRCRWRPIASQVSRLLHGYLTLR
jgi:hypothetical protein